MDVKRLVIGTVVGAIALYAVGWVIFDHLMVDFYEMNMLTAAVARESQVYWALAVGDICYALLMVIVIELLPGKSSIAMGVLGGFIVGLLHWGATDFTLYAILHFVTLKAAFIDPLVEGIHAAIAGGIVAAVLGMMGGRQAAAA